MQARNQEGPRGPGPPPLSIRAPPLILKENIIFGSIFQIFQIHVKLDNLMKLNRQSVQSHVPRYLIESVYCCHFFTLIKILIILNNCVIPDSLPIEFRLIKALHGLFGLGYHYNDWATSVLNQCKRTLTCLTISPVN